MRKNKNKKFVKSKYAQHEIAGFVIIVAIVAIIGVIFLSLYVTKGPSKGTSIEISNLLEATMYYTSDCAINFVPQYREIQDLIRTCYKSPNQNCIDGRSVCSALEENLMEVLGESLRVSPESPYRAYNLRIYYDSLNDLEPDEEMINFGDGKFEGCVSKPGGNHLIHVSGFSSGRLSVNLEVCKGS
ncbi:hypothetical protein GF386_00140 [Candidatus Pacearchaeota archaeon]|nr:hypothetical protein [Candidatus Pacearchaeota archaeon]MBD3282691.1 hypothetical protein [Candidatus Pacearchaeota archaeon]